MFHTFETVQYASPTSQGDVSANSAAKRKTSTVRACEPCRKRKIRCNGEHPCETCQWYRKAASCHYTEPRQRQIPSRRSVEKISQTLQEYRDVLQKLFPNITPEQLIDLPREKLVELISKNSPLQPPSPITPGMEERPPAVHPDAGTLEQLQPMPEDGMECTESKSEALKGITDDVNALALSVNTSTSYLGISSVIAVLRVIIWLDPESQAFLRMTPDRSTFASRESSSPPHETEAESKTPRAEDRTSSAWDEIPLINAFFTYVHPITPLLEEQSFRDTYMARKRTDSRWQLLLNVVLAMGSIAAGTANDKGHKVYYLRARQFLNFETLGSAHIETVQALALLSGFYLHYVQLPNQANSIMGLTLRLATSLGLHRDYSEGVGPSPNQKAAFSIELRRRIWWCVFNLDSWVGNTLGRPSMGRMSHAITAKPPQDPIAQSYPMLVLLQENIRFCIISTRMEDSLAVSPLLSENDRLALDAAFVEWYQTSSIQIHAPRSPTGESPGITVTKNIMRWRYHLSRVIIHRPILLWYAMRRMPFYSLDQEKSNAIIICRDEAEELINDIATTWQAQKRCLIAGWNATWLLYQIVMVPLLSLFCDSQDNQTVQRSRAQVETAMATLSQLQGWSPTAKRSLEVVRRIYEASLNHTSPSDPNLHDQQQDFYQTSPFDIHLRHQHNNNNQHHQSFYDQPHYSSFTGQDFTTPPSLETMLDSLNWSTSATVELFDDSPLFGGGLDYYSVPTTTTTNAQWPQSTTTTNFDHFFTPVFTEE